MFKGLFRDSSLKPPASKESYFDAVYAMSIDLGRSLPMSEWHNGLPTSYTERESISILRAKSDVEMFSEWIRNDTSMGQSRVSQTTVDQITRLLNARRLKAWADGQWKTTATDENTTVSHWKELVSTYLKVWLITGSPFDVLDVAELLARSGHTAKARTAIQTALLYQNHAAKHPTPKEDIMAAAFIGAAGLSFSSLHSPSAYSLDFTQDLGYLCATTYEGFLIGNCSPQNVAVLRQRAAEIERRVSNGVPPT